MKPWKGQANLEKGQKWLIDSMWRLENSFYNFQEETEQNFEYTNKNINQAFEKISENMQYNDKVETIFDFLKKSNKNNKTTILPKHKRESVLA